MCVACLGVHHAMFGVSPQPTHGVGGQQAPLDGLFTDHLQRRAQFLDRRDTRRAGFAIPARLQPPGAERATIWTNLYP